MADVVIFDPASAPVPNRVIGYLRSVDTPLYVGRPDALINPVLPPGAHLTNTKVVNGQVALLSQADLDAIAAAQVTQEAAIAAERKQAAKEFAVGVLNGEAGYEQFLRALVTVIVGQINALRTRAGMATVTRQQVVDAIASEIATQ